VNHDNASAAMAEMRKRYDGAADDVLPARG